MFVVTGGAGFIGSNIAAALDSRNFDICIVDSLGGDDFKWRNIAKRRLLDIVEPDNILDWLQSNTGQIEGIVHMGAISTTTETDTDKIIRNNFKLSVDLWKFCAKHGLPFIYASSAATYGDGAEGFEDRTDEHYLQRLQPLNPYGWSKHLFDRWVVAALAAGSPCPSRWAGLKFFNVYGPNEYHKAGQRSVAVQLYEQIVANGFVRLFRSDHPQYADGEQQRDFVWVGDCVDVTLWALLDAQAGSGLYNVGSGQARTFVDMAKAAFQVLQMDEDIRFVDLPENLKGKYQYYTKASLEKIRSAGFGKPMTSLEDGIRMYVLNHLRVKDRYI